MAAHPRMLALVSTTSGSVEQDRMEQVRRALRRRVDDLEVVAPPDDEAYAGAVATAPGRDVVVLGGDGSVHRLVQELVDQDLLGRVGAVGLVPMGTGNDLARGAGIPLDVQEAAGVAVDGVPERRALLLDEDGQVVVNVAHCGVAAEATAEAADVKGLLGRTAYLWGAVRAGLTRRGWHLRVVVDGRTVADGSQRALMVSVALGPTVGGGTPIAPGSQAGDGQVDVILATGTSAAARLGFARALLSGRHTERDDVLLTRGREVLVEAVTPRDAFRVNADGDVAPHRFRQRRWRVLDQAWALRRPG